MHIIFGRDQAQELAQKYTVLELDSFRMENSQDIFPAYCVIENVSIAELPHLDRMRNLHAELIVNYQRQNWEFCQHALEHLIGKWGGELDTFYDDLRNRVDRFAKNPPAADWSSVIQRT